MQHTIVFSEMLIGSFILVRNLGQIRKNSLVTSSTMTKIVAAFALTEILLMFVPAFSLTEFTVCWSVPIVVAHFLPLFIRRKRRLHFLNQRIWILNSLILHARLGRGIRQAISLTSERADFYIKTRLRQLLDRLITTTSHSSETALIDPLLRDLYDTLRLCEVEPHLTIQRLVSFRQAIEIRETFRRKSDRAVQQLRAQAYVLTALYGGLVSFVIWHFGFTGHERIIVLSMLLFTLGIVVTLRQGRKIKWSI